MFHGERACSIFEFYFTLAPALCEFEACHFLITRRHRAGLLNDLHAYDPAALAWTDLSFGFTGSLPTATFGHGFASAGGRLYVFGGRGSAGESDEVKIMETLSHPI